MMETSAAPFRNAWVAPTEPVPPDGPITAGIDGGYVRAAHKEGFFEVIAGCSVVAFRRAADDGVPEWTFFGYVQTYDEKAAPAMVRADEVAGAAGQVVFLWDGGEDVRRCQRTCSRKGNTGSTGSPSPCASRSCSSRPGRCRAKPKPSHGGGGVIRADR
jgi:hypothetical protein